MNMKMVMCTLEQHVGLSVHGDHTETYRLFHVLCKYPPLYSYTDEFVTILYTGDYRRVGRLFYTTVQSLTMEQ